MTFPFTTIGRQSDISAGTLFISPILPWLSYNVTNASLGGLAETKNGYVTAYHYQDGNVFLSYTPKDHFTEKNTKITQLWKSKDWNPFGQPTPILVSAGLDGGYVMWYGATYERFDPPKPNGMIGQQPATMILIHLFFIVFPSSVLTQFCNIHDASVFLRIPFSNI